MARRARYTLYDLLDVSPFATVDELQKAYWLAAAKFHPDTAIEHLGPNPSSADLLHRASLMKELNEAWEVLGDPEGRQEYDASIGLRRPGPTAVSLRNLSARLFRHRPAWRLQTRSLETPNLTLLRRTALWLRDTLWATRVGQWSTLALVALVWGLAGSAVGSIQGPGELVSLILVALALARGGEPTPLLDALSLMSSLVDVLAAVLRRLARQTWHSLWTAVTTPRAPASVNLEQDSAWLETPPSSRPAAPVHPGRRTGGSGTGATDSRRPGASRR